MFIEWFTICRAFSHVLYLFQQCQKVDKVVVIIPVFHIKVQVCRKHQRGPVTCTSPRVLIIVTANFH